jgi:hypothetical protein
MSAESFSRPIVSSQLHMNAAPSPSGRRTPSKQYLIMDTSSRKVKTKHLVLPLLPGSRVHLNSGGAIGS